MFCFYLSGLLTHLFFHAVSCRIQIQKAAKSEESCVLGLHPSGAAPATAFMDPLGDVSVT